jgi:type I restriction enzyme S subunit
MTSEDFETRHVKDVVSFAKGKPPAEQPYFGKDAELYLTPEYLRGGAFSEPIKANKNAVRVSGGETIVLWDGSNAGEVFRARPGVLSSTMVHLKPEKSFDDDYFFYAMKGWEGYLKGQTSGSGIPHVDKEVLGKLALLRYPINEQVKIAKILATVDQAIDQTEALIAKQQRIKTGLMQDLLTRGIDEHGQLRTEQTHAFKDSPLGRIPVEWEVSPAENLCLAVIDCKNRTPPATMDGHPVIRTPNVRHGEFVFDGLAWTDEKSYEIWVARGKPRVGDVVITREAPYGEACQIPPNIPLPCLGQRMMMYQTDPIKLRSDYLVFALYSQAVQTRLFELAGGSTVGHIKVGDIRTLPIPHPVDIAEQKLISLALSKASMELKELVEQKNKFTSVKTALMQDLLTGRKRITDLLEPLAA